MNGSQVALLCLVIGTSSWAAGPGWWSESSTQVVDPTETHTLSENYAPANLGQLKNMAKQARLHLNATLAGEAGNDIDTLVGGFEPRVGQGYTQSQIDAFIAKNYAPINLGQLKAVAKPFYDRLHAAGFDTKANLIGRGFTNVWASPHNWTGYYPWNPATAVADNYAPANIGQLKMVFSFDLSGFDTDKDGLPDAWEVVFFGDLNAGLNDDADRDGLTNGQEFAQGSNPDNYYDQGSTTIVPVISITGGNDQLGPVDEILETALQVEVRDGPSGPLLENAPIVFTVVAGGGVLLEDENEITGVSPLTVKTDSNGIARAFLRQGSTLFATNTVTAQAASSLSVTFQSQTVPREALWGYWRFNETNGTVADDSSEFGNDGTLVNTPEWSPRYVGEGGILFSGAVAEGGNDSTVNMGSPSNGSLDFGTDSFSIAVWVKFSETSTLSGSSGRRIVSKGAHDADSGYFIGLMGDGKISAGLGSTLSTPSTESLLFRTVQEFDDNAWHQVVVVFDQNSATAKIYIDGVAQTLENDIGGGGSVDTLDGTLLAYESLENLSATNELVSLTVGSHEGTSDFFKGGVDDLKLYRKTLTAVEVLALYRNEGVLTALSENVSIEEDTLGSFVLKSTGGGIDSPSCQIVTPPLHGEAILGGNTISYYPNAHYNGTDTIRFRVAKGGREAEADLVIAVTAVNDPPLVSVGGALNVTMPDNVTVTGAVSDIDTFPGNIGLSWRKVSGPGVVTFSTPSALTSTVTFSAPGQYVLRLTADDGEIIRGDSLLVTVNPEEAVDLPTISLNSPIDNATQGFALPFAFKASASAGTGQTVAKVEFYEGSRKIGESLTPDSISGSYELSWAPPRLGVYATTAIVTTNTGLIASSNTRQIIVSGNGWFAGSGMIAGNEGYAGSGGLGGIASGSASGPSSSSYQNGKNGGTETAGGGGNGSGGARNDASLDSDGDGLSDLEEKELGSDPHEKKSDDDDLEDGIDADPVDPVVNWERVADSRFAVVTLGPAATNSYFLGIGNKGDVLDYTNGAIRYWKDGAWSNLAIGSRELGGVYGGVIQDSGEIVVNTSSRIVGDTYMASHALKWGSSSGSATSLTEAPEEYLGGIAYDYVRYSKSGYSGVGSGKSILYKYYYNNAELLFSFPPNKTDTIESLVLEGVTLTRRVTHKAPDPWYEVEQEGDDYDFFSFYITRSGHSYVFKTENGIRRSLLYIEGGGSPLDITAELSSVGYRSESPDGDPLISSVSLSKVLQSGEWKAAKDYLGAVNLRGEGLRYNPNTSRKELWRNGRVQDIEKLCSGYMASEIQLERSNDSGVIFSYVGTGVERKSALLVPVDMAVDANRDGFIRFSGNYNDSAVAGKPQDKTEEAKPFRFWINDDDDGDSGGGEEMVDSSRKDYTDGIIKTARDLEDFTRLFINIGGLHDAVADGTFSVGLEWRNTNGTNPAIKVYRAAELDGGDQYLKTEVWALNQTLGTVATALGTVSNGGSFKFPASFWQEDAVSGAQALSADHPNRYLIFEGAGEGKGQLVLTFWKGAEKIGEAPGAWIELLNIKKMYVRSDGNQFVLPAAPESDDTIIFVHGWRMSPNGRSAFAESFYKRLWHRGFKGRFAAFQWETHWNAGNHFWAQYVNSIDAYLSRYNDSEHVAWNSAAALKTFVNGLPGERKHIAAHSMGNIVTSEAIRLGMGVNNYALMQAAVPSACYDPDTRTRYPTTYTHFTFTMWDKQTPDDDPDLATRALAYRGRFSNLGVNLVSFYLERDYATFMPWEVNNDQTKPEGGSLVANFHYLRNNLSGQKLYKYTSVFPAQEMFDYYLTNSYEAMSYACSTWGKAVGAQNIAQGALTPANNVDLSSASFALPGESFSGFGDEHSGQFKANIHYLKPFYDALINKFEIGPPNP